MVENSPYPAPTLPPSNPRPTCGGPDAPRPARAVQVVGGVGRRAQAVHVAHGGQVQAAGRGAGGQQQGGLVVAEGVERADGVVGCGWGMWGVTFIIT